MKPIRLAEPFRAVFYAPFYVAEQRGFYARHGVTVTRATAGDPTARRRRCWQTRPMSPGLAPCA